MDATNANIGAGVRFQYGDGATPVGSAINTSAVVGNFAIVLTGATATGEYDFEDVAFAGSNISNLTGGASFFVFDETGTAGAGTFLDPGTAAQAAAASVDVLVAVDNSGSAGSTIDLSDVGQGSINTLVIDDNQALIGLVSGQTIDASTLGLGLSAGPSANFLFTGLVGGTTNITGSGVTSGILATVATTGANNTISLAGTGTIQSTVIDNVGTGDGVNASFATAETVTIRSATISGGTGGDTIDIATTAGASTVNLEAATINGNLRLTQTGGTLTANTVGATNTINAAAGQAVAITGATTNLSFASITGNGGGTTSDAVKLQNLGANSNFTVTGTTTLDNYTNDGIEIQSISQHDVTVSFGATNINTTVGQVVAGGDGLTVATISGSNFDLDVGALSIGNTTNDSDSAITIVNVTGTGVDIDIASYTSNRSNIGMNVSGFNTPGATITVAGTTNITNARADGIRIGNSTGNVTFAGNTTITNNSGFNGDGVELGTGASGPNTGTYSFAGLDVTVNGVGAFGLRAQSSGTLNITGGTNNITSNNGTAVFINPTITNITLQNITSINSADHGISLDLAGAGSTFTVTGATNITSSTNAGIDIANSEGTASFGATTINNVATAGGGVNLTANPTATVNFNSTLDIDTSSGTGFTANNGGAVTVTGAMTIDTTTGAGLNVISGGGNAFTANNVGNTISTVSNEPINISNATVNATFATVSASALNGSKGIDINNHAGTLTINGGTITNTGSQDSIEISGGNSTISIATDVNSTNATGLAVDVTGRSGGTVTISGNLSDNNATGGGIFVNNNANTTINISGTSKVVNTATADAVTFTSNSGSTIDFSNGGLDIDTTSGTGITISNSSAFNASGLGNTIDTTSGAIIAANGVTFGATFASASATGLTGATDGVNVANSNGTLTISGGTMTLGGSGQGFHITSSSVTLSSAQNVVSTGATSSTVRIQSANGGSNTFSGNFTDASGTSGGTYDFLSNTGGSTTFTGDVRIDSGNNNAILLSSSAAHTVNFNGTNTDIDNLGGTNSRGLVISGSGGTINFNSTGTNTLNIIGSGKGIDASSGGGTVVIGGTLNVTTATGTAVDISNVTIGAAGVTLRSVSKNGGTNGILLNNTGTAGGFTITGDGSTTRNNSGGTIQNTTGDGIRLINTSNVSLAHLDILSGSANGVFGTAVNGFSISHSTIRDNGNAVDEGQLRFADTNTVTPTQTGGTGTFTFNNILAEETAAGNNAEHIVEFLNISGTMNLTVTDSAFQGTTNSGIGGDGFLIETRATANSTVNVTGSTFTNNFTQGFQGAATDSSTLEVNIGTSTITNNNEGIVLSAALNADLVFDINNNTAITTTGATGAAIFVGTTSTATSSSSVTGYIRNNANISNSATSNNHAVSVLTSGDSISTIEISNNTITHGGFFRAINVSITDNVGDTADLAITITNNNVNSTNAFALQPILVQGRNSGTICADISGNTVTVPNAAFTQDIRFRERDLSTVTLEQGGSISAVVATVLNDNNTLSQSAASVTGSPALVANGTCRDVP